MKTCPNCNEKIVENAKFCFNCGLNFSEWQAKNQNKKAFCEKCGTMLQNSASFCTECGTKVSANLFGAKPSKKNGAVLCLDSSKNDRVDKESLYEERGFLVEKNILKKYVGQHKNVVIPQGIKSIGEGAFYHCLSIESVEIPSSVRTIEKNAFKDCGNLRTVKIETGLEMISNNCFGGCIKLEKINFPSSIKKIEKFAFAICYGLTYLELPESISIIENCAFSNCINLKNIKVSKKCKCIGEWLSSCPANVIYY